jgi:hypothetical protein
MNRTSADSGDAKDTVDCPHCGTLPMPRSYLAKHMARMHPGVADANADCMGECDPATGGFTHRADCPVELDPERTKATADATIGDRMLVAQAEYERAAAAFTPSPGRNVGLGITMYMLAAVQSELDRLRQYDQLYNAFERGGQK